MVDTAGHGQAAALEATRRRRGATPPRRRPSTTPPRRPRRPTRPVEDPAEPPRTARPVQRVTRDAACGSRVLDSPRAAPPRRPPAPGAADRPRPSASPPWPPTVRCARPRSSPPPAWSARRSWAGTTTSSTATPTPATTPPGKPVADGRLDAGTAWYAVVVAVLLVVPLSISTGVTAGTFYLGSLVVGLLGNVVLRRGRFSFLSWAGAVRALRAVPLLRRLGRRRRRATRPRPRWSCCSRCSASACTSCAPSGAWWPTTPTAGPTCRCALGRRLGATRLLRAGGDVHRPGAGRSWSSWAAPSGLRQ